MTEHLLQGLYGVDAALLLNENRTYCAAAAAAAAVVRNIRSFIIDARACCLAIYPQSPAFHPP